MPNIFLRQVSNSDADLLADLRVRAMKEIEKHRKAMIGLYLGACIGAGAFTLLPSRYLGGIVWSYFGLIN